MGTGSFCNGSCTDGNLNWILEDHTPCDPGYANVSSQQLACGPCSFGTKAICGTSASGNYSDVTITCQSCPSGYIQIGSMTNCDSASQKYGAVSLFSGDGTFKTAACPTNCDNGYVICALQSSNPTPNPPGPPIPCPSPPQESAPPPDPYTAPQGVPIACVGVSPQTLQCQSSGEGGSALKTFLIVIAIIIGIILFGLMLWLSLRATNR